MEARGARISRSEDTFCTRIGDEEVLLNYQTGVYYSLDEVGTAARHLIESDSTLDELIASLLSEYNASHGRH